MTCWFYTNLSRVWNNCDFFRKKSLLLTKATFIQSKIQSKLWNIISIWNSCFLCEYLLNCNLFMWSKLYFQHHYSSLQCHMIFRNHSNMLICCSRNISDYYQCWKQLCCTIFLWKLWYILFFRIHRWIESSKEQHLFEIEIFCNVINVFIVTFD